MSKFVSSSEIWDKVRDKLGFPNPPKGKVDLFIQEDFGNFKLNHYNTGFGIRYSHFIADFYQDTILENTNSYDSSFICYNTGKDMHLEDAISNKKVKFKSNSCWNGQMYEGHLSNSLYTKGNQAIFHNIMLDDTLFNELIQNNESFNNLTSIYKGNYINVNFNNTINTKQKLLLEDLLKISKLDDRLQLLYLESKLLDLVYTTINSIEPPYKKDKIFLSNKDIESLNKAKFILTENIMCPPSLKELAHQCAINEFKLKKGFKQLHGNTVYGFLQEFRLNEAKKLLQTNEINISEATFLVGYKSISHFSKIFKEHFGVTPIEIKKESRKYYF